MSLGVLRVFCGSVCMFVFVWVILSWCPLTWLVYIVYNIDCLNILYHKNHIFTRRYDRRKTIAVFMYTITCKKPLLCQHQQISSLPSGGAARLSISNCIPSAPNIKWATSSATAPSMWPKKRKINHLWNNLSHTMFVFWY